MGDLEDEVLQNHPELKNLSDKQVGIINSRLDAKAAEIETAMLAEIAKFKEKSDDELKNIKTKLDSLINLDAEALKTKIKDLQDANKALGNFLDQREERFKSLGSNLGSIVKKQIGI
jgi:hypothetical protein